MKESKDSHLGVKKFPSEVVAKKKDLESQPDFGKKNIELAIVDIDTQLLQLAKDYGNISKVRAIITIQQIRKRLFEEVFNQCLNGLDVRWFASHGPGDTTPLNSRCWK